MVESLTFNEYFDKWLLVGSSQDTVRRTPDRGIFYSLSDDLIHWTPRKLIREAELPWSFQCGDRTRSTTRPCSTRSPRRATSTPPAATPYLYFTRLHYRNCVQSLNRDLVRVPIRFSK